MCGYHTWFRDDRLGFVIACPACGIVQMAFGMLMIRFAEKEFHSFRAFVREKKDAFSDTDNIDDKTILMHTPCEAISFLLSYRELSGLYAMLEEADTEMITQKMLQLFSDQYGH